MNEIDIPSFLTWTSLAPAFVIGSGVYLYGHTRMAKREREHLLEIQALKDAHNQALHEARREAQATLSLALTEAEAKFKRELAEVKKDDITVSVYPFVNTAKDDGLIFKDTRVEIGYKYQLFVKGLPCFAPHVEITESFVQKEVNQETMARLRDKAEQLADAAVLAKTGPAGGLIKVARASIGNILGKK